MNLCSRVISIFWLSLITCYSEVTPLMEILRQYGAIRRLLPRQNMVEWLRHPRRKMGFLETFRRGSRPESMNALYIYSICIYIEIRGQHWLHCSEHLWEWISTRTFRRRTLLLKLSIMRAGISTKAEHFLLRLRRGEYLQTTDANYVNFGEGRFIYQEA